MLSIEPDYDPPPGKVVGNMPRKLILSLLVLVVLAIVFTVVRGFELRRTAGWRAELERYLHDLDSPIQNVRIIAVDEAASPQNFSPERLTAYPTDWTWEGIREIPPPLSVQCVLLEGNASNKDVFEVGHRWEILLIGYHDDGLWHSGWLVHQFRYGMAEEDVRSILFSLGCDLGLDNLQARPLIIDKKTLDA